MGRNGVPMTGGQGSMSKLKGGDVAMWATTTLMDLVGPEAQSMDCPLEKWFRDAKIYQIFEAPPKLCSAPAPWRRRRRCRAAEPSPSSWPSPIIP